MLGESSLFRLHFSLLFLSSVTVRDPLKAPSSVADRGSFPSAILLSAPGLALYSASVLSGPTRLTVSRYQPSLLTENRQVLLNKYITIRTLLFIPSPRHWRFFMWSTFFFLLLYFSISHWIHNQKNYQEKLFCNLKLGCTKTKNFKIIFFPPHKKFLIT